MLPRSQVHAGGGGCGRGGRCVALCAPVPKTLQQQPILCSHYAQCAQTTGLRRQRNQERRRKNRRPSWVPLPMLHVQTVENSLSLCASYYDRSPQPAAEPEEDGQDASPSWVPSPMKRLSKLLTSCSSPSSKTRALAVLYVPFRFLLGCVLYSAILRLRPAVRPRNALRLTSCHACASEQSEKNLNSF